LGLKEHV